MLTPKNTNEQDKKKSADFLNSPFIDEVYV